MYSTSAMSWIATRSLLGYSLVTSTIRNCFFSLGIDTDVSVVTLFVLPQATNANQTSNTIAIYIETIS